MKKSSVNLFVVGITYVRNHPQLLMTLLLIIVIPVAFLVSGQQFLSAARDNQERLEKDRVGIMHDLFASFVAATNFNTDVIQTEITHIIELNPDITELILAKEEGDGIRIVSANDPSLVNTIAQNPQLFRLANTNPNESLISPFAQNGERFWQSVRLIRSSEHEDYYVYLETSLAHVDALFASRIMTAYLWLLVILIIVLFLIVRHVRLIDYSYLYSETKKANEMKDLFTNMIAHELRAPLTAMRGYASMVRENDSASPEIRSQASKIEDAAGRLVLIVGDLLDVARIHSGKLSMTKSDVNIQTVVASVIESMQSIAKEKNIVLTQDGFTSPIHLNIDEKRLFQALTNLVSNSLKYTNSGSISVAIDERTDRVELRVKDTGMGISADNQKNLFAPFFRVHSAEVDQTVGTGLGMWITKQLIELMNGSIGVESIRGVGTHIVVTLPKK